MRASQHSWTRLFRHLQRGLFLPNAQLSTSLAKLNPSENSHFVLTVAVPRSWRSHSWGSQSLGHPLIISNIKFSKTSTARWPHVSAAVAWTIYLNFPLDCCCHVLLSRFPGPSTVDAKMTGIEEKDVGFVLIPWQQWKMIIWAIWLNQVFETNPLFFLPLRAALTKNSIKRKSSHKWAHTTRANHK